MSELFTPYDLSGLALPNRLVMAPMTRSRAASGVPDDDTALYYQQRASAGLIISEGIPISREGVGFLFNPGLYTDEQQAAWSKVTAAVHEKGGRIFAQLWHVGRLSHASLQENNGAPVSAVPRRAENSSAYAWVEEGSPGQVPASEPRALTASEIKRVTADFVRAAQRAIAAGFDGVELHGANGYLFEQFINGELNTRQDMYGGSIQNRLRFLLETLDALAEEVGANRVGARLSPFGRLYDMRPYPDEAETWVTAASELDARRLAYVHLSDQLTIGAESMPDGFASRFCSAYKGTLIVAGGFDKTGADAALRKGGVDLVGFGRPFIANPDLVERLQNGWPLTEADRATFYGLHGSRGYTDYPRYAPDA
ncbi:alkene reductase [Paraburkholderia nemoris]|uniref:alkene reductase n=1 Tax=Paraburkholderia nemoris TaxID=2793076 RepID=UPI0038BB02EA